MEKIKPWDTPLLIERTLKKNIDLDACNYHKLLNRFLCTEVYSVVAFQMKREESYCIITKDIKEFLSTPYIQAIIKKSKFSDSKSWELKRYLLKYKIIFPLFIWFRNKWN